MNLGDLLRFSHYFGQNTVANRAVGATMSSGKSFELIYQRRLRGAATDLSLSLSDIDRFILSPPFLEPCTNFRDHHPLEHEKAIKFSLLEMMHITSVRQKLDRMILFNPILTSPFDRPTTSARSNWTHQEQVECLIYQITKNLACAGQPLANDF